MGQSKALNDAALDEALVQLSQFKIKAEEDSAFDAVAKVVDAVVGSLSGDLSAEDVRLYREVEDLASYIRDARSEIAALNPTDIQDEFLPTATDELDAIVQATEQATGAIMDATEVIEDVASSLDQEAADSLQQAVTAIYEACSFQDITGQRITKIVRMLKSIESRVDALVSAFDPQGVGLSVPASAAASAESLQQAGNHGRKTVAALGDSQGDDALLNGPQASDDAMGQAAIDALLNDFD
jgi:chemotaxis protein CheZ